ncbi:MAG TPA: RdgB/HAM1 family non-canonical purine NTP pyrophosphatase [Methylomirabilota bacterium]|nr:RdgB/HAM1 family non-canonical purine NTP pyrophosphatase [Methylomirabilota bacterium]
MTPWLVLATANPGKRAEFQLLLAGLGYGIRDLADYPGITLPPEGGVSYAENALAKARATAAVTGAVTLGDDSGLEVDALGGRPGVASARYGGPGVSDAARVARLLAEMVGAGARGARFRCVLALVGPWGAEETVEGVVEGLLAETPRGHGGFGYDPIFLVPGLGRTLAELTPAEKARMSHRGQAAARVRPILTEWLPRARGWTRPG